MLKKSLKTNSVVFTMMLFIVLILCGCSACKQNYQNNLIMNNTSFQVQINDSINHVYGDSIANIIFNSDSVQLLKLSIITPNDSLQKHIIVSDSMVQPNFHGCYILQDFGNLSAAEIYPLLLILSDKATYYPDNIRVQSPFLPDVALVFHKNNEQIDMVFSFSGGQMYVFSENGDKEYIKYDYERLIMLFFQKYLQNENIDKYLNL